MKKVLKEFRDFITRGNVLDMAVGVILASAFGKITASLVNDLLMPFISWIFGAQDTTALNLVVRPEITNEAGTVIQKGITIGFGTFLTTIIDFLLIALVIFFIVRAVNRARSLHEKKAAEAPPAPLKPSAEEKLLTEIRDLLKEQHK
ncbi:MAG: large-conductance mechanosensitive channel protein MscL [Oscillospiraceae bacterium]|nr:large-conductance mechanosensitive channel protein MscL [Oscillospiraceae bacterium]